MTPSCPFLKPYEGAVRRAALPITTLVVLAFGTALSSTPDQAGHISFLARQTHDILEADDDVIVRRFAGESTGSSGGGGSSSSSKRSNKIASSTRGVNEPTGSPSRMLHGTYSDGGEGVREEDVSRRSAADDNDDDHRDDYDENHEYEEPRQEEGEQNDDSGSSSTGAATAIATTAAPLPTTTPTAAATATTTTAAAAAAVSTLPPQPFLAHGDDEDEDNGSNDNSESNIILRHLKRAQEANQTIVSVPAGHYTTNTSGFFLELHSSMDFRAEGGMVVIDCQRTSAGLEVFLNNNMRVSFHNFSFVNCLSRSQEMHGIAPRRWDVGPTLPWCNGCWCALSKCSKGGAVTIVNRFPITNTTVSFIGCRFEGNAADKGGAVSIGVFGSMVDVHFWFQDSTFYRNAAEALGGSAIELMIGEAYNTQYLYIDPYHRGHAEVRVLGSSLSLLNCTFYQNLAKTGGGTVSFWSSAAHISDFAVEVDHCNFTNNKGGNGAGLGFHLGAVSNLTRVVVNNSYFEGNTAQERFYGGGFFLEAQLARIEPDPPKPMFFRHFDYSVDVVFQDTTFVGNRGHVGGAISMENGKLSLENVEFFDNSAEESGGAVCLGCVGGGDSELNCRDSWFEGNHATGWGSTFSSQSGGTVDSKNCTFIMNGSSQGVSDFQVQGAGEIFMDDDTAFVCREDHRMIKSPKTISWGMTDTQNRKWNELSLDVRINRMSLGCLTCPMGQYTISRATLAGPIAMYINSTDNPQALVDVDGDGTYNDGCLSCDNGEFLKDHVCTQCPPGRTMGGHSAVGEEACGLDIVYLLCEAIVAALCLCITVMLPMATGQPISIDDISLENGQIVVDTCGPHRLLRVPLAQVRARFSDTGLPQLDKKKTRFDIRNPFAMCKYRSKELSLADRGFDLEVLDTERLVVLNPPDEGLGPRMGSSQGYLKIVTWRAPFCTGVHQVPVIALLQALVLALVAVVITKGIQKEDVAITMAIGFVVGSFLHRRTLVKTTLSRRIVEFKRCYMLPNASKPPEVPRGAGRAISVGQLLEFFEHFQGFVRHRDMNYIVNNMIRPLTAKDKLSFAECVGPKQVEYYVSHFWGDAFPHFVESLHRHAEQAKLHSDWRSTAYWICSFSNNQWKLEDELRSQCDDSSFFLALMSASCRGTVMVVNKEVSPLTRCWCLFELLQTFKQESSKPDTFEGLALATSMGVLNKGATGVDIVVQIARQLSILQLEEAKASRKEDEEKIKSYVGSMPGGFPAMNSFVRSNIRQALLKVKGSFESDFAAAIDALDIVPLEMPTLLTASRTNTDVGRIISDAKPPEEHQMNWDFV